MPFKIIQTYRVTLYLNFYGTMKPKCTAFNTAVSRTHLGVLHSRVCHQSYHALHMYTVSQQTKLFVWKFVTPVHDDAEIHSMHYLVLYERKMVFKYTFKYSLHKFTKTYYIKKNYSKTSLQRTRIRRTLGYNVLESAVPTSFVYFIDWI